MSRRTGSGGGSPTKNVRARVAVPAVDDRAGVDRDDLALADRAASPGMPWTISSSIEMQTLAGNGRRGLTPG